MAEIRSTMEMVLERAERLCSQTPATSDTTYQQEGMKAGVQLLQDKSFNISAIIQSLDSNHVSQFTHGVLATLLRNIALPREEGSPWQAAIDALEQLSVSLTGDTSQIMPLLSEVTNILGRYHEHCMQVRAQLEEAFTAQAAQMQQNMEQQTGRSMNVAPSHLPKFNEELQKHLDQLNEQYTNALSQYKQAISQIFD